MNQHRTLTFASFSEEQAKLIFNLKSQPPPSNFLDEWIENAKTIAITEKEQERLDHLIHKLELYARSWNEEELKLKFIGQIIELVNFDNYELEITAFSERPLSVTVNSTTIKGVVDFWVASGQFEPHQPYFFIHEYKREQDNSGDAAGQLLAALYVAQTFNGMPRPMSLFDTEPKNYQKIPIYGIFVIGRIWSFVRLIDHEYFISKAYDSGDMDDLQFIFKMLKAQRNMIFELAANLETA
jgi:hypothetical protein